jgi:hypothetical protein
MFRWRGWIVSILILPSIAITLMIVVHRSPFERRFVNRPAKSFPEETDLSTPESIAAAFVRKFSQGNFDALNELSWLKMDADMTKRFSDGMRQDQEGRKHFKAFFNTAEICEVLTYRGDFAIVLFKSKASPQFPCNGLVACRIDGTWKCLMPFLEGKWPSLREAEEHFEKAKDGLWKNFDKVRDDVRSGRDLTWRRPHDSE